MKEEKLPGSLALYRGKLEFHNNRIRYSAASKLELQIPYLRALPNMT